MTVTLLDRRFTIYLQEIIRWSNKNNQIILRGIRGLILYRSSLFLRAILPSHMLIMPIETSISVIRGDVVVCMLTRSSILLKDNEDNLILLFLLNKSKAHLRILSRSPRISLGRHVYRTTIKMIIAVNSFENRLLNE